MIKTRLPSDLSDQKHTYFHTHVSNRSPSAQLAGPGVDALLCVLLSIPPDPATWTLAMLALLR